MSKFLSILCTTSVLLIGFGCFHYYLQSEVSFLSVLMGLIGFVLVFSPAWEKWNEIFSSWIENHKD
jgi:hypothetical protein